MGYKIHRSAIYGFSALIPFALYFFWPTTGSTIPNATKPYMPAIIDALNTTMKLCIDAPKLELNRSIYYASYICSDCQQFEELGLIKREFNPDNPRLFSFALTPSGEQAYTPRKFCFGQIHLNKIIEASHPSKLGPYILIKYNVEVISPHPAIYNPNFKKNNMLPIFSKGSTISEPLITGFFAVNYKEVQQSGHDALHGKWIWEVQKLKKERSKD